MSLSEDQLHTLNLMVNQVNNIQDTLPSQLESINKSLNELQARLNHFDAQIQEVYNQLQAQQQNSNANNLLKIKIRLPTPFNGQSSLCNTFFSQLSLYFAGDLSYDTDDKKILLATSCLTGPAYAYMEPFLCKLNAPPSSKPEILTNYKVFMETITAAFGDSDPTLSAELALRRLRQISSATSYATEFRRLSSLVHWNNAALVSQYKVNLRDAIQDELARRPVIQDLEELILESIDIDNRLFQRQRSKRFSQAPVVQKDSRTTSPVAMDIDKPSNIVNSSRQVSQDERLRRNQEKACYYCGVVGHFSNQCPAKKSSNNRGTISTILLGNSTPSLPRPGVNMLLSVMQPEVSYKKPVFTYDDYRHVQVRYDHSDTGMIYIPVRIGSLTSTGHGIALALVDTGAATSVISKRLAKSLKFPITPHSPDVNHLQVADGRTPPSSGTCTTKMRLFNSVYHVEEITLYVMDDAPTDLLLGLDWFKKHHVIIDFKNQCTKLDCDTGVCCDTGRPPVFTTAPWEIKKPVRVPLLEKNVVPSLSSSPSEDDDMFYVPPIEEELVGEKPTLSYPEHPLPSQDISREKCPSTTIPFVNKDTVYFYSS